MGRRIGCDSLAGTVDCAGFEIVARRANYVLLALAVIRFWISPLASSFWLDETGTFWTIKDGFTQMFVRIREFPSITPAYGLIAWTAYALGGAHEYAMRLPSVIAISFASLLLYRLAKRLLDDASALTSVTVFICSEAVVFAASDARVYAFVLMAVTGSTLALVYWLDSGDLKYAVVYVIVAALVPHFHYLACPVLGIHSVYALTRLREGVPVPLKQLLIAAICIGVLLLPVLPNVLELLNSRAARSFADKPDVQAISKIIAPPVLVFATAVGLLLAAHATVVWVELLAMRQSTIVLLVTLTLGPVFLFFAISRFTSTSIFVPRYMIASQVGLALLAGWTIGRIQPPLARHIVTASIILCSIGAFGKVGLVWPSHFDQDWRGAMAAVRRISADKQAPVVVQSGFVEAPALNIDGNGNVPSYLMAPLSLYPVTRPIVPLPYKPDDERTRLYLESTVLPIVEHSDRFVLVTIGSGYIDWLAGRLPSFTTHNEGSFGRVVVTLFQCGNGKHRCGRQD
jgi:4-amino-4-deoxy-L-arabinose transferase-like glycosyltransferase